MKITVSVWMIGLLIVGTECLFSQKLETVPDIRLLHEASAVSSRSEAEVFLKKCERLPEKEKLVLNGIIRFNLAVWEGDKPVSESIEANREALEKTDSDISKAYYGGSLVLDSWNLFQKNDFENALYLLQNGLDQIDQAVQNSPQLFFLRVFRIEVCWNVSANSPIQKWDTIEMDLTDLDSHFRDLPGFLQASTRLYQGLLFEREGKNSEAEGKFREAVKICPECPAGIRAKEKLTGK